MLNPVDPTTTPAWKRLTELHDTMTPALRAWFADDPQRAERFSYELGDLYVDLSKNLLTDDVRDALVALADAQGRGGIGCGEVEEHGRGPSGQYRLSGGFVR